MLGGLDHHRVSEYEAIARDALSQWGPVIRSNDIHQTLGWRSNVDLITGPTCGKAESQDRRRGRLHGRGLFGGGTYVGKMKRGNGPQIRCHEPRPVRIPRIQTTKSVVGKHSGSASLAMVRNTDCHKTAVKAPHTPSRPKASSYSHSKISTGPGYSSIITVAIVPKACDHIYSNPTTLGTHIFAVSTRGLTRSPCQDGLGQSRDEEANGPDPP